MLDEWFYKTKTAELGPVAWEELRWLADHRKLDPNALVRRGRTGKWLLAKRIKGLIDFTSAANPASAGDTQPNLSAPSSPSAAGDKESAANAATGKPLAPQRTSVPTLSFTPAAPMPAVSGPPLPPQIPPASLPPASLPPASLPPASLPPASQPPARPPAGFPVPIAAAVSPPQPKPRTPPNLAQPVKLPAAQPAKTPVARPATIDDLLPPPAI
ncbi:MAG TPA: GYF domain-containing protein [Pirellulales bacterium]|jgi:hypothetical protein|nr:GYF domain-containing protein [Pirellulales bacterium]